MPGGHCQPEQNGGLQDGSIHVPLPIWLFQKAGGHKNKPRPMQGVGKVRTVGFGGRL